MKKLTLSLLFFISINLNAQSFKEKMADKKFENYEFVSASEMYEELSRGKEQKIKYLVRAGECNLNAGDYNKAQIFYDRAYGKSGMTDHDLYNYYQVLKYNSNYTKASEVFAKISNSEFKWIRENLTKKKLNIEELKKDSGNYTLKRLDINSDENDFCPYVVNDELYFLSSRRNTSLTNSKYGWDNSYFLDIYKGKIVGETVKDEKAVDDGLKTKVHEGPLCFSKDGNTQFITRNNYFHKKVKESAEHKVNLKIFIRKKEGEKWTDWTEFPYNSDDYSCGHPAVSLDGKTLYFVSDMPGSLGLTDIWVCHLQNDTWAKPENLGHSINSEGREMFPQIFEDDVLFYSSDGKTGLGGLDIFFSVPGGDSYFESQNLGYPLNSHFDDFGFCATTSTTGYLSSNRGTSKDDIYSFVSTRSIVSKPINFIVKDIETKIILPNSDVSLIDELGKTVGHVKSNEKGEAKFSVLPGKNYKIKSVKEGYKENTNELKNDEITKMGNVAKELLLIKKMYGLHGLIADAEKLTPIDQVRVSITDVTDKKNVLSFVTSKEGDFKHIYTDKGIGDDLSYIVKLEKEGYMTKIQKVDLMISKEGYVMLDEMINLKMYKIKLGADLAKMIDLRPIYFDLGKYNITPASATELDKIVAIMKENPSMTIELGSHTDCRGSALSNASLSDKRAKSSAAYIVSKGITSTNISGKGYGESKLINGCKCEGKIVSKCTEDEHAQNRRTEFKIVKIKN